VIRVEPQEPIAGDPGLLDGEAPLLGVGIERPLERADIGEPSGNRHRLIGRSAVDDHDLSRPGQSLERSAYVRRFVIGEDDGGDFGQHDALAIKKRPGGGYRDFFGRDHRFSDDHLQGPRVTG
jgi:hypothetical protein